MTKPGRDADDETGDRVAKAFLVVRRGGRWTDLLRLTPEKIALVGRASANQIVIRSHQASRQHAEIRWIDGQWWIRDLASRNGTVVNRGRIDNAVPLSQGDCIEIAGCAMTFFTDLKSALAASQSTTSSGDVGNSGASDDQLTMDGFSGAITRRTAASRYVVSDAFNIARTETDPDDGHADQWQMLFGLAFRLSSVESIEEAAQITTDMIVAATEGSGGGVYLPVRTPSTTDIDRPMTLESPTTAAKLVAFIAAENRSYRAPAPSLVDAVMSSGDAVIARNIVDDSELQGADSRGEFSVTTAMVAPIFLRTSKNTSATRPTPSGYLHVYSDRETADDSSGDLRIIIAAAGVLSAAIENLRARVQLTRSLRNSRRQIEGLRARLNESVRMIGTSSQIAAVKRTISQVAKVNTTVLVRGESGVGKELVAASIHQSSPRRDGPMVCLNCAALSPTLLESELFGHEKGAFTGATEQKKGKFESAHGGTLMLDEIGEMHVDLQAKLLRVLEGHPFERLGGQEPIRVDVRLIAATNRDLASEVAHGRFRSDLYYRLNVIEIVVPPLRERPGDIIPIADHYVRHFAEKMARRVDGISADAAALLVAQTWPGNIRELKNAIERAVVLGCNSVIEPQDLNLVPPTIGMTKPDDANADRDIDVGGGGGGGGTPDKPVVVSPATIEAMPTLNEIEQQHLIHILRQVGGNKSRAAIALGIERSTLDRKLKRYNIEPSQYK